MFNLTNKDMPIKITRTRFLCFDKDKRKKGKHCMRVIRGKQPEPQWTLFSKFCSRRMTESNKKEISNYGKIKEVIKWNFTRSVQE